MLQHKHLVSRWFVFLCVVLLAIGLMSSASLATEPFTHGKAGLSASLQSGQQDIAVPIWTSEKFMIMPMVSFVSVSDQGRDRWLGLALRFYRDEGRARHYVGLRGVLLAFNPKQGDSMTDYLVGPSVGGEYFLDAQFSLTVEGQVNVSISHENSPRFGNPDGTNINTATAVYGTFYF